MKTKNFVMLGASMAAASVVLLGACSSGANLSQESNPPSQSETSRDAGSKGPTTTALTGKFAGVEITHAAGVNCREIKNDDKDRQFFDCSNIAKANGVDAVLVKVKGEEFKVGVLDANEVNGQLNAVQRDANGNVVNESKSSRAVGFRGSDVSSANRGWSVGVGTNWSTPGRATISILKD